MNQMESFPTVFYKPRLSILILTYQRPKKIKRLLEQFLEIKRLMSDELIYEIVIADDCSQDDTYPIIESSITSLKKNGLNIRYICRATNLGGDGNLYKGYRDDCTGDYVWILCDDDILVPHEAVNFLKEIVQNKPAVAVCQFAQGKNNQYGTKFSGKSRVMYDNDLVISALIRFPKTSAYVLMRDLTDLFDVEIEKWNGTLFSWIGMSILLFAKHHQQGVYIHVPLTVQGDDEYGDLRYSYRVFLNLNIVAREAVQKAFTVFNTTFTVSFHNKRSELQWCLRGLYSHYNPFSPMRYEKKIIKKEFIFIVSKMVSIFKKVFIGNARRLNIFLVGCGFDILSFVYAVLGIPVFLKNFIHALTVSRLGWPLYLAPVLSDRYKEAGVAKGHYFNIDLWAARKVYSLNPKKVVDVGSRIDGFVSHILTYREIEVFDIRDFVSTIDELKFRKIDMMNPEEAPIHYADCVTSLHAIEHFGLGRYGDPVTTDGWKLGIQSIFRILTYGGTLLMAVPISGKQRIEFDAHRVFSPTTIIEFCQETGFELVEFCYINDEGNMSSCYPEYSQFTNEVISSLNYGCGCFVFCKK